MNAIIAGFTALFSDPISLALLFFGIFFGIVFGCIPGLTATLGVALMIPFTFTMTPIQGLTLLVAIYVGGISGGLITATLINIPGTPSSIFTCYDGYPMAKSGKPGQALAIGVFASLIGGTFSAVALFAIAPQLAKVSLIFGNWEYFAVAFLGLMVVVTMSSNDFLKGLIGALIGLIVGCIGLDAVSGVSRLTFGAWQLQSGLQSTALMMGLFAIREIFNQSRDLGKPKMKIHLGKISFLPPLSEMKDCLKPLTLGCLIGTGIGILPGIGQNASTLISYNQAKAMSKHPEKFGHGSAEGICASEVSNNAVNGGALIPLITLGIPGDLTTAALIGGLMIQGLQPGPLLFTQNIDIVGTIMVSYFLANIVMYVMELGLMNIFVKAVNVKFSILFPAIVMFCVLGVFALNNRTFDIWILIVTGILAYILDQLGVDMAPIILGFILGPLIEKYYRMGMISENGNFAMILQHPIAVVCLIISLLFVFVPLFSKKIRQKKIGLNI
ncbi:tripartite tricarboxylate transporter permease [Marasmitruncus massiliensis]|uniref:tripartite tricarboxylate transporter permease n=1 Tax=Marasmitruncus massiliensis TaxID=1944642 RepID=UPI000C7AFCD9|nr:tripartite tricarboxylate transporter permease [Marasmitruncus massiliensis]